MTIQTPLVIINGQTQQLPVGDEIDTGGIIIPAVNNTGVPIPAQSAVNLFDNAGTLEMRLANATDGTRPCHGFVGAIVADAATGNVIMRGDVNGHVGLTLAGKYYLDIIAGDINTTAPTVVGNIVQILGIAVSATTLRLFVNYDYTLL